MEGIIIIETERRSLIPPWVCCALCDNEEPFLSKPILFLSPIILFHWAHWEMWLNWAQQKRGLYTEVKTMSQWLRGILLSLFPVRQLGLISDHRIHQCCIKVAAAVRRAVSVNAYLTDTGLNKAPIKLHRGHEASSSICRLLMLLLISPLTTTCCACCCNKCVNWFLSPTLYSKLISHYHTRWMHCFPSTLSFVHPVCGSPLGLSPPPNKPEQLFAAVYAHVSYKVLLCQATAENIQAISFFQALSAGVQPEDLWMNRQLVSVTNT